MQIEKIYAIIALAISVTLVVELYIHDLKMSDYKNTIERLVKVNDRLNDENKFLANRITVLLPANNFCNKYKPSSEGLYTWVDHIRKHINMSEEFKADADTLAEMLAELNEMDVKPYIDAPTIKSKTKEK